MSLSLAPVFLFFSRAAGRKEASQQQRPRSEGGEKVMPPPSPSLHISPLPPLLPSGPFWAARPRGGRTCPYDHLGGPKNARCPNCSLPREVEVEENR